ncbi:hypothetical protein F383_11016 [Gossypium arboreum]|uniref:Uncharacterized protein n=1 Tax=Gossypium arboreum TaxID=29729 RepID=A0A0B0NEX4_GOSAR|nr:hypothetical protein F383_11016 [Gossypium arboreum]
MGGVFTSGEVKNNGGVRLDTIAVRLETTVECVFGFKLSCSGELRIENDY